MRLILKGQPLLDDKVRLPLWLLCSRPIRAPCGRDHARPTVFACSIGCLLRVQSMADCKVKAGDMIHMVITMRGGTRLLLAAHTHLSGSLSCAICAGSL